MATGRITKKVLDYIAEINRTNKSYLKILGKRLTSTLVVAAGTQSRKDQTKVKYYDRIIFYRCCGFDYYIININTCEEI